MLFCGVYHLPHLLLSSLLVLQQSILSQAAAYDTNACNNSPHLCGLSYGNVTYLGTHNAPFLRDQSTSFSTSGNQYFDVSVQLDAGVRLLQGQLHSDYDKGGEPRLCHSTCTLMDAGTLSNWLSKIKAWMDLNTSEVVTLLIVNEDRIPGNELLTSFTKSGIDKMAYVPSPAGIRIREFPTLQTMINDNKRLVVFVTSGAGDASAPFLLNEWDYIWETKWENKDAKDWSCAVDRPPRLKGDGGTKTAVEQGVVPLLNWYLYTSMGMGILRPYVELIKDTNGPSLVSGLKDCKGSDDWKPLPPPRVPTFVLVDFFNEGSPMATIDALNNVTYPVNRVKPPPSPTTNDNPSEGTKGRTAGERVLDELLYQIKNNGMAATWADWILAGGDWGQWSIALNRVHHQQ